MTIELVSDLDIWVFITFHFTFEISHDLMFLLDLMVVNQKGKPEARKIAACPQRKKRTEGNQV